MYISCCKHLFIFLTIQQNFFQIFHLNKILTRAKFGERVSFLHNPEPMRKAPRDTTFGLTLYTLNVCENKIYNINILHNSILNC